VNFSLQCEAGAQVQMTVVYKDRPTYMMTKHTPSWLAY